MTHPIEDDELIFEAAAQWWLRQGGDGPYDPEAFKAWLVADTRHPVAYRQVMATWDGLDVQAATPEFLSLRSEALDDANHAFKGRRGVDRRGLATGAGLAAAVAGAGAIGIKTFIDRRQRIETGTGEPRTFNLEDHSHLTVDAHSAMDIAYGRDRRVVHLLKGRAYFEVARDAARPFRVVAGRHAVTALGSAFTVEVRDQKVAVTLLEGRIAIRDTQNGPRPAIEDLRPLEQQVFAEDAETGTREMVDAARALGWRDGKLFFDDAPLSDAVSRMNDYSDVRMSVVGPAANLRINGMFLAGRTDAFVQALQNYYPVTVARDAGGIVLRTTDG